MNKLFFSTIFLFSVFSFMFYVVASAEAAGQPIYGGGPAVVKAGNVIINKTVQNPQTNAFADNLGLNDPKYAPDQTINFQLSVTNVGNNTVARAIVKDIFPQHVSFVAGPGSFDKGILSFEVTTLNVNETRTFNVSGKVASAGDLPIDSGATVCVINQANVTADNQTSQDTAQFCIQKPAIGAPAAVVTPGEGAKGAPVVTKGGKVVFPPPAVTITPPTGPEALALLGFLPTSALGYFLRRKSILR